MLEGDFTRKLNDVLREEYPLAHIVKIPASQYSLLPYDTYILTKGLFIAVESKRDKNQLLAHQALKLAEVIKNGGVSWIVRYWSEKTRGENKPTVTLTNMNINQDYEIHESRGFYHTTAKLLMGYRPSPVEDAILKGMRENLIESTV